MVKPLDYTGMYPVALYNLRAEQFDRTLPGQWFQGIWMPHDYKAMTKYAHSLLDPLGLNPGQGNFQNWCRYAEEIGGWSLERLEKFVELCERDHGCKPPEPITLRDTPPAGRM